MLVALTLPLLAQIETRTQTWYGPAIATFQAQFGGNPYDPDQNDVRVQFIGPEGAPIERMAYYDGDAGYKAILVSPIKGKYKATLIRNGHRMLEPPQEGILSLTTPLEHGFVHPDKQHPNRFQWDDGTPFYPIGFNLGWQNDGSLSMIDQIAKMGHNGVDWTRIWSDQWDGKNPWWPQGEPALKGQLWPKALDKWQSLVDACERAGVEFQMVLFDRRTFSSSWPDHPWNAKNGGFLNNAGDFFTDTEAKRRVKMWLRYAVARYGSFPNVMAWELFDEFEQVGAREPDVAAWHKEMAEYLRTIDPYRHMITTSSATDQADVFTPMDYYQPHAHFSNLPKDKPGFLATFEPPSLHEKAVVVAGLRDGIYGGITTNEAGAAMFWPWDAVESMNLYDEFKNAAEVIHLSEVAAHSAAHQLSVKIAGVQAKGIGLGESDWMLLRLTTKAEPAAASVTGLSLSDADYAVTLVDLDSGQISNREMKVSNFSLTNFTIPGHDVVMIFKRK